MAAHVEEFRRLMARAGVTPYRRVGKVRAVYVPQTPAETVQAALAAVRQFAPALAEYWDEPTPGLIAAWQREKLAMAEVCDDPAPRNVNPAECPVAWLVGQCRRYHFRVVPAAGGGIGFESLDGWQMSAITPLLPAWFVAACKARRQEIAEFVATARESESDPEGER